jgi:hypothetical protein
VGTMLMSVLLLPGVESGVIACGLLHGIRV